MSSSRPTSVLFYNTVRSSEQPTPPSLAHRGAGDVAADRARNRPAGSTNHQLVMAQTSLLEPEPPAPFGSGLLRALCLMLSAPFSDVAWQADEPTDRSDHALDNPSGSGNGLGDRYVGYSRRYRYDEVLPCGLTRHQVRSLETREITPEDHDLLLALDQALAKKGVLRSDQLSKALLISTVSRRAACSICLEMVEPWQRAAKLRSCGHGAFHRKCLAKWLTDGRDSCPLCNARVAA